jgi:hypothetical protein
VRSGALYNLYSPANVTSDQTEVNEVGDTRRTYERCSMHI